MAPFTDNSPADARRAGIGLKSAAALMRQLDRLVGTMTDARYTFVTVSELLAAPADGPGSLAEPPA